MTSLLYANDIKGEYPPSFYAASAELLEPMAALDGDLKTGICIIGAGYSGLSAALHLRQKGHDVTVIDAHRVGWGASGRNGGQVSAGQRVGQAELEKLVGKEDARKLWSLSLDSAALVQTLIKQHRIDCNFVSGVIHANHKPNWSADTKAEVEHLRTQYDYQDVSYVSVEEMRSLLATEAYFDGSYDAGGGHLNPLKYALGLARACLAAGVRIFEQTEAKDIKPGKLVRIGTDKGTITADHLVIAANGYLGTLNKRTANRVIPINNYIIATEPLAPELATSLIRNNAAVADSKFVINYYRLSEDNRLLFGGRESYGYKFPEDIRTFVRKAMLTIYPQLADTRIDYGWGGTLGITMNRMPYFDFLAPNMITIGGYSGHGVAMATLGGKLAAEAICGTAEGFDVMARVPTRPIPGGYSARLPLLFLGMAYYSLRDRL